MPLPPRTTPRRPPAPLYEIRHPAVGMYHRDAGGSADTALDARPPHGCALCALYLTVLLLACAAAVLPILLDCNCADPAAPAGAGAPAALAGLPALLREEHGYEAAHRDWAAARWVVLDHWYQLSPAQRRERLDAAVLSAADRHAELDPESLHKLCPELTDPQLIKDGGALYALVTRLSAAHPRDELQWVRSAAAQGKLRGVSILVDGTERLRAQVLENERLGLELRDHLAERFAQVRSAYLHRVAWALTEESVLRGAELSANHTRRSGRPGLPSAGEVKGAVQSAARALRDAAAASEVAQRTAALLQQAAQAAGATASTAAAAARRLGAKTPLLLPAVAEDEDEAGGSQSELTVARVTTYAARNSLPHGAVEGLYDLSDSAASCVLNMGDLAGFAKTALLLQRVAACRGAEGGQPEGPLSEGPRLGKGDAVYAFWEDGAPVQEGNPPAPALGHVVSAPKGGPLRVAFETFSGEFPEERLSRALPPQGRAAQHVPYSERVAVAARAARAQQPAPTAQSLLWERQRAAEIKAHPQLSVGERVRLTTASRDGPQRHNSGVKMGDEGVVVEVQEQGVGGGAVQGLRSYLVDFSGGKRVGLARADLEFVPGAAP
eukprot:TRINITY_DN8389_c0_g1_i1.p1 TRINITY_DN8389_c0_g1~~TRINITY_DN8389_c0_g1_i1.p1  ORF type:complete len:640 (+),score=211.90 TRINITY_DN8389_c0_g1_i1:93-1922(+)